MSRIDDDWAFPDEALAVVMRTDAQRTKCIDVAMRKIGGSGDTALYAGVFHPFRAADYEAKLTVGGEAHDIAFTVAAPVAAQASAPIVAAAPAPAVAVTSARAVPPASGPAAMPLAAIAGVLALGLGGVALARERRRTRLAA